jgi:hypothetical protein
MRPEELEEKVEEKVAKRMYSEYGLRSLYNSRSVII